MRSSDLSRVLPGAFVPREARKALYAIRNASREPAGVEDVESILRTGRGRPTHVRALFGDLSPERLLAAGAAFGLEWAVVLAAYHVAREAVDAANFDLDALGV